MDLAETIEFLRNKVALFKNFPDARLKELVEGSRIITFEPNEAVIRFGEEGRFLGIHLDGGAKGSITDDSGEKHHIDMMSQREKEDVRKIITSREQCDQTNEVSGLNI